MSFLTWIVAVIAPLGEKKSRTGEQQQKGNKKGPRPMDHHSRMRPHPENMVMALNPQSLTTMQMSKTFSWQTQDFLTLSGHHTHERTRKTENRKSFFFKFFYLFYFFLKKLLSNRGKDEYTIRSKVERANNYWQGVLKAPPLHLPLQRARPYPYIPTTRLDFPTTCSIERRRVGTLNATSIRQRKIIRSKWFNIKINLNILGSEMDSYI